MAPGFPHPHYKSAGGQFPAGVDYMNRFTSLDLQTCEFKSFIELLVGSDVAQFNPLLRVLTFKSMVL